MDGAAFTATCSFRVGIIAGAPGSGGSTPPTTIVPPEHPVYYTVTQTGAANGSEYDYYVEVDQAVTSVLVSVAVSAGSADFLVTRSLESGGTPSAYTYDDFGHVTTHAPADYVYNVADLGPAGALKIHVKSTAAGSGFTVTVRGA